jgi:hypothetical protein
VNKIIEMATQVGFDEHNAKFDTRIEAFANLIAEKEREKILAVLRRKPDQQIYKVLDEIRGMK